MKKIIKKIKGFYEDNERIIKIATGTIVVGTAAALLKDNIRMKGEIGNVKRMLIEAYDDGNNVLVESQTKVRKLIEDDKKGTDEWHNEVVQSTYCVGGLNAINFVSDKLNRI